MDRVPEQLKRTTKQLTLMRDALHRLAKHQLKLVQQRVTRQTMRDSRRARHLLVQGMVTCSPQASGAKLMHGACTMHPGGLQHACPCSELLPPINYVNRQPGHGVLQGQPPASAAKAGSKASAAQNKHLHHQRLATAHRCSPRTQTAQER